MFSKVVSFYVTVYVFPLNLKVSLQVLGFLLEGPWESQAAMYKGTLRWHAHAFWLAIKTSCQFQHLSWQECPGFHSKLCGLPS